MIELLNKLRKLCFAKQDNIMPFFLLFILIPLAEIIVFMNVSGVIGLGTALLMALLTAILGGSIVRYQGIQTLMTAQKSLRRGAIPSKELFDGLCLVAAGATLITPGFITDAIGFALLIPPLRDFLRKKMLQSSKFQASTFGATSQGMDEEPPQYYTEQDPSIIDVEYETIDEESSK